MGHHFTGFRWYSSRIIMGAGFYFKPGWWSLKLQKLNSFINANTDANLIEGIWRTETYYSLQEQMN